MTALFSMLLVLALSVLASPGEQLRDYLGLLGGDSDTSDALLPTRVVSHPLKPSTRSSSSQALTLAPAASQSSEEQWSPTSTQPTYSAEPTIARTALASTSVLPASALGPATDYPSKTWQIIGITIIAVLFIVISITCAMFFDRLWGFLKDVISCTSHPLVSEEFILDCEKQDWETRIPLPSPSDRDCKAESVYAIRPRGLPWNTGTKDWNTLHRHPSRKNDNPPPA